VIPCIKLDVACHLTVFPKVVSVSFTAEVVLKVGASADKIALFKLENAFVPASPRLFNVV